MEDVKVKKNSEKFNIKAFKIFCVLSLIITIVFLALIFILLQEDYAGYDVSPTLNDSILFFYQTNGFVGLFFAIWLIRTLVPGNSKKLYSAICFWGILVFSILYASAFASNLYFLNQVTADVGFAFFATYTPTLCLIISLIAVFSFWDKQYLNKSNKLTFICCIISLFMTAYYCLRAATSGELLQNIQIINLLMVIFGAVVILSINLILFLISKDKLSFDQIIYGMSNREAAIEELAQTTAETVADNIKGEIETIEKAAELMNKDNPEH